MTWSTNHLLANPAMRSDGYPIVARASAGNSAYRWTLARRFEGDLGCSVKEDPQRNRYLPWLMLNPSAADHQMEDPTLRRVCHFSWAWGFAGVLVLNVFPHRTPHPAALAQIVVGWSERGAWDVRDDIHANHDRVQKELAAFDALMVAWGSPSGALGLETDAWANNLFEEIDVARETPIRRWCLGRTKAGDPIHPMARGRNRVPDDAHPERWLEGGWA